MVDEDFPYIELEDDDVIAKFKRIEDASSFAANHEWQDARHTVSLDRSQQTPLSTK
jgi:hypothetical protein